MFVWHRRWSRNPGCSRLPSPASEPASKPSPHNAQAHTGAQTPAAGLSCVADLVVCVYLNADMHFCIHRWFSQVCAGTKRNLDQRRWLDHFILNDIVIFSLWTCVCWSTSRSYCLKPFKCNSQPEATTVQQCNISPGNWCFRICVA